ncbi:MULTISPECIES: hypothetical protein [Polyangium]|uniref:Tetratricopeptide repeat protein n=2 Tax=Polyangium TaxID=55 RepID=A0A4U1JCQ4_9BACT|nr:MULTISPECIES: hypothetical protein [Polyangium]MDI1428013.1 hypothetical protein [Polyangium sorediatum]TKD06633.1 hypothetical protein E8A74_19205 [Polyangium fumosum]
MDFLSPGNDEPREGRVFRWVAFIASAALVAAGLRFALHEPLVAGAVIGIVLAAWLGRWLSRRRLRRVLRSGDVIAVLRSWAGALERIPYPATMGPLMAATAFAACGWIDKARAALAAAERGPVWEAAIEHRLFLDTLLLTFEGDRDAALEKARRLVRLPLPRGASVLRDRVLALRSAAFALARAFAHQSEPGDDELLERASENSPLVFWAMRYAAAVIAIDRGDNDKATRLLAGAPPWPEESIFRAFHLEIEERARLAPSACS